MTRPPGPRVTTGSPDGSSWNDDGTAVGGHHETALCESHSLHRGPPVGWSGPALAAGRQLPDLTLEQIGEEPQVVAQQARREELAADLLLAEQRHMPVLLGVGHDLQAALGALGGRADQVPGHAVLDLQRDAADVAADDRPALPEALGHGEPEPLARGLLQDHVGVALERVDLHRADVVEVGEDEHVGVAAHVVDDALEVVPALGVVAGHGTDERELHVGVLRLDGAVDVDHAERVLPRVEAGDLQQQRAVHVDAELAHDVARVLRRELHVLGGQRVDGRRDLADGDGEPLGHVVGQRVHRRVVAVDGRQQVLVEPLVRRGRVDVAAPDPPGGAVLAERDEVADGERLRVVDDDEVVGPRECGGVGAADLFVERLRLRREVDDVPL